VKYAPLLLVALLGACSQQPVSGNSATAGTANAAAPATAPAAPSAPVVPAITALQPGKWQSTVTILDLKIMGLPPGMKTPQPAPVTRAYCLTPEQASKGPSEMVNKINEQFGDKCSHSRAEFSGGKIGVSLSCQMAGGTLTMEIDGTATPTSIVTDANASLTGKTSMTEKVHSEARRIGACD